MNTPNSKGALLGMAILANSKTGRKSTGLLCCWANPRRNNGSIAFSTFAFVRSMIKGGPLVGGVALFYLPLARAASGYTMNTKSVNSHKWAKVD